MLHYNHLNTSKDKVMLSILQSCGLEGCFFWSDLCWTFHAHIIGQLWAKLVSGLGMVSLVFLVASWLSVGCLGFSNGSTGQLGLLHLAVLGFQEHQVSKPYSQVFLNGSLGYLLIPHLPKQVMGNSVSHDRERIWHRANPECIQAQRETLQPFCNLSQLWFTVAVLLAISHILKIKKLWQSFHITCLLQKFHDYFLQDVSCGDCYKPCCPQVEQEHF